MTIRHNNVKSMRVSMFLLGIVLVMVTQAMAQGYRHTISIDGVNDFNSGEVFETTSTTYSAFFSWDDDYLYLGASGTGIGNELFYESILVIYLDPDLSMVTGAETGRTFGSQQPAFLSVFRPEYLFGMVLFEPDNPWLQEFNGEFWDNYPSSITAQSGLGYFEAAIPLAEVGNPTTLGVTFSIVYTGTTYGESTHSGVPLDIFTNGYDPDYANHLPFDFSSPSSPNGTPLPTMVQIVPVPDIGSWELTGPDSFFASGTGDSIFMDVSVGDFTVIWFELGGWRTPPTETKTLMPGSSLLFTGNYEAAPTISSILDIPEDQGGQVRMTWNRIIHDDPLEPVVVTEYEIYRRQDGSGSKFLGWDFVVSVPAHGDLGYQSVVPTLCDSTTTSGLCWSVFMIRAATDDPYVFYESLPDSGYSVDNLAPGVPLNILAEYQTGGVALDWSDAEDEDFRYYRVYRDMNPDFLTVPGNLVKETSTSSWTDTEIYPWGYHYKITALDHAGNESEAGSPSEVTGVQDGTVPTRTSLLGAVPNPFNPSTKLSFELAAAGHARLKVYDAAGRLVAILVDERRDAGRHEVVWDGRDHAGRSSSAGVYLYRLEIGDFMETKRMTLVK